jgi:copper homeostasis protein
VRDSSILVEACVDSVDSALAAERAGAARVELCDNLFDGGTTPSVGMIEACVERLRLPTFVLVRPRGGEFVVSSSELDVMRRDVRAARRAGAAGVVIGALRADGRVDRETVAALVGDADGMRVTFHRAFDAAPDLEEALDGLRELGIHRVLTSGAETTALVGAARIASLVARAGEELTVMAGGGVRAAHVRELVERTGVREVHMRGARLAERRTHFANPRLRLRKAMPDDEMAFEETDERAVRAVVEALRAR